MSFQVTDFDPTNDADLEFNMVVSDDLTNSAAAPGVGSGGGITPGSHANSLQNTGANNNNIVEDEFTRTMKEIAQKLGTVAGKVSEAGIRRLAGANGFEVFDEQLENGNKRISLGGAIILIDIDIDTKADRVVDVKLSLGSPVQVSDETKAFNSKELTPTADKILLSALHKPLLGDFSTMLQHLARSDHLSLPSADCFVCMDEIAIALMHKAGVRSEGYKEDPLGEYGAPVQNPKQHLGLGIWYWEAKRHIVGDGRDSKVKTLENKDQKYYAFLTMMRLSDLEAGHEDNEPLPPHHTPQPQPQQQQQQSLAECTMRHSTKWINEENGEWTDPEPLPDAKGCFVLELCPPVLMTRKKAMELNAVSKDAVGGGKKTQEVVAEDGLTRLKRTVYLPKSAGVETMQFTYAQTLEDSVVEVAYIPLPHPREIPRILNVLRQHVLIWSIWDSVTKSSRSEEVTEDQEDRNEISFADAIMEYESCFGSGKKTEDEGTAAGSGGSMGKEDLRFSNQNKMVSVLMKNYDKSTSPSSDLMLQLGISTVESCTFDIYCSAPSPGKLELIVEGNSHGDYEKLLRRILEITEDIPFACVALEKGSNNGTSSSNSSDMVGGGEKLIGVGHKGENEAKQSMY